MLVKCPSVQWQPDDLSIRTNKWFLGARFLGAHPISLMILILILIPKGIHLSITDVRTGNN